ncbi:MAG: N-6 DNA methylase [Actinobacteria bacterium]|nr:N-6 DNA methylase [Actinomycetota bacterium]
MRVRVAELVENFRINEAAYKNPAYNETQTRREFIDPFFKALGWDIDNEAGYAPAYKDVIHEDAIKVGGMTKAPDYCFRIGGQRKFFVEAKKPAVDMKNDPDPYYQLRRYAYSAKLPLSIVTDFEELAIVDCRAKPLPSDKASTGRIRYWRYDEYLDHLEELLDAFSPEGIKRGGLDRMATSAKAKRGTGEVDKEFLKEIESWRELLAKNIALRNPGLSQRELNEAVQVTIDRIIFLRICEDRGIEDYGNLHGMQNGANVYARLLELFQKADERYNSGLFHFREERGNPNHPDELTLGLTIDDKPLKQILKGLYYPDSPYEFSVLPIDILGQVYEQFLGKVIRLTAGHQAKVEDKPEVKKAGGVYYTPTYIVDYIVKNTVGKLLADKTPKQAEKLRILDPACGSGSFLIGAYEYLLDWHRDWYSENEAKKWATGKEPRLFAGKNGWQLTTAEKKRILLGNIYGVDIDPQAVEVTKLSLLLKVLEEESQETINSQLKFFHERALPDLGNNIKCGNSLIGTDFFEGQQMGLLEEEVRYRVNAFDWDGPGGFPEIMKAGGFDIVIGNPPWGAYIDESEKPYFKLRYSLNTGKFESYIYFVERVSLLLNKFGLWGFITPSYWISRSQTAQLREFLFGTFCPHSLIVFPENVFAGVKMDSCIIVASRNRCNVICLGEIKKEEIIEVSSSGTLINKCRNVPIKSWLSNRKWTPMSIQPFLDLRCKGFFQSAYQHDSHQAACRRAAAPK